MEVAFEEMATSPVYAHDPYNYGVMNRDASSNRAAHMLH